jgi:hypothetical protein
MIEWAGNLLRGGLEQLLGYLELLTAVLLHLDPVVNTVRDPAELDIP